MAHRTVYVLMVRLTDKEDWSEKQYFRSKLDRDKAGSFSRIIGGLRTHSIDEKMTQAEIDQLEFEGEY